MPWLFNDGVSKENILCCWLQCEDKHEWERGKYMEVVVACCKHSSRNTNTIINLPEIQIRCLSVATKLIWLLSFYWQQIYLLISELPYSLGFYIPQTKAQNSHDYRKYYAYSWTHTRARARTREHTHTHKDVKTRIWTKQKDQKGFPLSGTLFKML